MRQAVFTSPFFREFPASADRRASFDPTGIPGIHAPLAGLAGSDQSQRFRYWRGASGRRYLFSVFPIGSRRSIDLCPRFDNAVVLAVKHGAGDEREILCLDQTGTIPDLFFDGQQLRDAVAVGGNEIHVHLLTEHAEGRLAMLRDLAA